MCLFSWGINGWNKISLSPVNDFLSVYLYLISGMSVRALFPTLDTVVSLSYIQRLISDDEEGESCWMSCLQCHQLTGTYKGVGIDVSKLLVAFKGSEKEGGKERGTKKCVSSFFVILLFVNVSPPVTHNPCIFVPLKASLATSLMPFLLSRLSIGREAKLQTCSYNREQSHRKLIPASVRCIVERSEESAASGCIECSS